MYYIRTRSCIYEPLFLSLFFFVSHVPDCNYYSIEVFSTAKFSKNKTFSLLHLNTHSIQRHIEELRSILSLLDYKFDIQVISNNLAIHYAIKISSLTRDLSTAELLSSSVLIGILTVGSAVERSLVRELIFIA